MSRPLRIEFPGAYYHVMNRGLAYQPIFKTDKDRETLLDLLGDVHARWGLRICSYCLMSNHYHLCVQTPTVPLARIMRHVDGVYTQRFNRQQARGSGLLILTLEIIFYHLLRTSRWLCTSGHAWATSIQAAGQSATYRIWLLGHQVSHAPPSSSFDVDSGARFSDGNDYPVLEVRFDPRPWIEFFKQLLKRGSKQAPKVKPRPTEGQIRHFERQLERDGRKSLEKSQKSIEKNLEDEYRRMEQYKRQGGHTSSMERDIERMEKDLEAIKEVLRRHP